MLKISKSNLIFSLVIILFVSLFVFVEIRNEKFWTNDLKVYFDAAADFFNGNNPYIRSYGLSTGFFKYPPTTLYFFWFSTKISFFSVQLFHVLVLLASLLISIFTLRSVLSSYFDQANYPNSAVALLYLSFIFIAITVVRELHMGNVNLILLMLFSVGLFNYQKQKDFHVALFWSIMVIIKPIVLFAFIPLLFYKRWKIIGFLLIFGIIYFLFPAIFIGIKLNMELWQNWFVAITKHGEYLSSYNSLTYLASFYFKINSTWIPSLFVLVLLISIFVWKLFFNQQKLPKSRIFLNWTIIFFVLTPNFFITDTEHFLLTLPILILIFGYLISQKKPLLWVCFILLLIPFSLNSNDLLGRNLSGIVDEFGLVGISNLGFIFLLIYLEKKSNRQLIVS